MYTVKIKRFQRSYLDVKNDILKHSKYAVVKVSRVIIVCAVLFMILVAAQLEIKQLENHFRSNDSSCHIANTFSGVNHKTGTVLFSNLNNVIQTYQNQRCRDKMYPMQVHIFQGSVHFDGELADFFRNVNAVKPMRHTAVINSIRNPIDTILSGYNYHKVTNESWTKSAIEDTNINGHLAGFFKPKMEELNANYLNMTLQNIYNSESLEIGLNIEYFRYLLCEQPRIQRGYQTILYYANYKLVNDEFMHFRTFRLEEFAQDFNQTAGILMDVEGIFDEKHRFEIMNALQAQNVYDENNKNMNKNAVKHGTRGKYDRKKQINVLLSNQKRCKSIKQMGESLDYKWKYESFC